MLPVLGMLPSLEPSHLLPCISPLSRASHLLFVLQFSLQDLDPLLVALHALCSTGQLFLQ